MLSLTIIQFQTTHKQHACFYEFNSIFVCFALNMMPPQPQPSSTAHSMLHVYMCWIDYYGVLYSVFWMAPLWVHTHNYSSLNGFNSEVVHEHSATHYYLLSIPFHFSQPFDKHYFYWQVISQLIWLRLVYLFIENWTGLPVNGHRFNRKHCTSAWSRLKFHINIRVFVCVCSK